MKKRRTYPTLRARRESERLQLKRSLKRYKGMTPRRYAAYLGDPRKLDLTGSSPLEYGICLLDNVRYRSWESRGVLIFDTFDSELEGFEYLAALEYHAPVTVIG